MVSHAALQDTSRIGAPSTEATALAEDVLLGDMTSSAAIAAVAGHLLGATGADVVVCALTRFAPDDPSGWIRLGGRAWLREWVQPGSSITFLPPPGAGPEAALTMPWMSAQARSSGLVVVVDGELLPAEAAQDRSELERIGVGSFAATSLFARGEMFGSMSAARRTSGHWPEEAVADLRLLRATLTARLLLEESRHALAEAIETGSEVQLAYRQFFGSVGHELRTPLAAVLGYSEVLLDDAEHGTPELVAEDMLRDGPVIVRACEQLISVVDSLLGSGRTLSEDDQRQHVSVADAVADVVHWHRTPARTAEVEIFNEVEPDVTVWAHAAGVRQVLTNLLGNAVTHHHPGGGTVHLSAQRLLGESGRPMVRIIVRDDGPGLAPEQMEHVFEPFVRFADRDTKGSGLGLSISRTIAERDGGAVRGESHHGHGSTFWLELPAAATKDPS
ncbi:Signal transduction histidine kinase [Nocardioides exalbidus]|uniref:histidine kinase n=1 Tax=Nocardioides exalbidus TaxID=402596 RepID=A0A1H4LP35_9ACTN|nr:HAMP domain-containing sensor histidine kinase [Nocardioides exalbidus]SEB72388.1 Signal transduction histidine kinase [Nocardioides exalbidus]